MVVKDTKNFLKMKETKPGYRKKHYKMSKVTSENFQMLVVEYNKSSDEISMLQSLSLLVAVGWCFTA